MPIAALAAALATAGMPVPAVQLLGTGKWDEPNISSEPALIGAWFGGAVAGQPRRVRDPIQGTFGGRTRRGPRPGPRCHGAGGGTRPRSAAAAVHLAAALTDPSGFYGRDGLFRLTADGLAERRLAILRVDRDGVTVIDEPPRSFAAGS
ncbi:MAG: hypothetical protein U1E35_01965 [Rhodospirillales bacterium]